jgi:small-conductance mechanosensitive channel
VGGIGSASVVLALRSTMENIIGGLLLKLQDKMRVGEVVTVPGENHKAGASMTPIRSVSLLF